MHPSSRIDRRVSLPLLLVLTALMPLSPVVNAHATTPEASPAASICAAVPADATPASGTAAGHMGHGTGAMPMMGTPGAGMGGAMMTQDQFDLMYLDLMIAHHEGAVVMSTVALERAEHPEIRQLAEEIIATQTAEIAQLRAWRDAWFPNAPVMPMEQMSGQMSALMAGMPGMPGMTDAEMMAGMDAESMLVAMCTAPEPFDLAFIDAMIPHHQEAVAMANVALDQTDRPDLVAFNQGVIDTQSREIRQMEEWRTAWYGAPATPAA